MGVAVISKKPVDTGTILVVTKTDMTWFSMCLKKSGAERGVGVGLRGGTEIDHQADAGNDGHALGITGKMVGGITKDVGVGVGRGTIEPVMINDGEWV